MHNRKFAILAYDLPTKSGQMNILLINWRDITHPWAGGAERHVHELAKEWSVKKHRVTLLCGNYKGGLHREVIDGIEILRIAGTYSIFFFAPFYYLLHLSKSNFDSVIEVAHGVPFFTPFFTSRKKILIVHHNHEKLWYTEWNRFIAAGGTFLENKVVPLVYRNVMIITLSNSVKKELQNLGLKKLEAIPPGIDRKVYKPYFPKPRKQTILYLGRLRKYKRIDMLLNIFPKIKKRFPGSVLVIAGTGQDRARLMRLARIYNLNDSVIFKGFVSEEEKVRLLQEAAVLVYPSIAEGWGLVSLEAAACGTPTIAFHASGIMDAVKDGKSGIIVRTKKEFYESLIRVLKDSKMKSTLSKGALKWAEQFDWRKSAQAFLDVLQRD